MKKHTLITTAALGIALLAGCSSTAPVSEAEPETATTAAAAEETAPTQEPQDEVKAEPGTRENPARPGQDVASFEDMGGEPMLDVTVSDVDTNADAEVKKANPYNEAPAKGSQYVMVTLDLEQIGAGPTMPMVELSMSIVTTKGNSYDQQFFDVPNDISGIADMFKGAKETGVVVFEVPKSDIKGSTLRVQGGFGTQEAFFAVK